MRSTRLLELSDNLDPWRLPDKEIAKLLAKQSMVAIRPFYENNNWLSRANWEPR